VAAEVATVVAGQAAVAAAAKVHCHTDWASSEAAAKAEAREEARACWTEAAKEAGTASHTDSMPAAVGKAEAKVGGTGCRTG
jgi:hypothetical protein